MQPIDLSSIKNDVDYSQIPPIQQKRIITFVNHFITSTVSYLNNFCNSCEDRFMQFEYKMQKIEASLLILETQISSIPGFDKLPQLSEERVLENSKSENVDNSINIANSNESEHKVIEETSKDQSSETTETQPQGIKASDHPMYVKFFKMLKVGVQEEAIKLKMQSEGLDSSILNNPEAIIPEPEGSS